ncbi:MAG: tetratricopeptide repeat protein, partial [Nitrospira sp.]|nr:tetratricopeptide repeat protein [Nitrospira sp.]
MATCNKLKVSITKLLIKPFFSAIVFMLFTINTAFAGLVTFEKEYTYQASKIDSKVSCRAIALEQVKRLLLEELGTFLESETKVMNFLLTKDQITALTAVIVRAEVIDEKWDGKTYYLKAKISADPEEVAKSIDSLRKDHQKTKELEETREKAEELTKKIKRLKKELEIVIFDIKRHQQKVDVKKIEQYNEAIKGLSATDWFEKGYILAISGKYKEAIDVFNRAIELNPKDARAYNNRGSAYQDSGNYWQAINDYNRAIELDPNARAYNNRGSAYQDSGNYWQAINDYNRAIELDPNARAYNNRGAAYYSLGNYKQAIKDY